MSAAATNPNTNREGYDFRWGIPELDDEGGTAIPGFILRNYAKAGVAPIEMMAITHLSAYRYNSPDGQSSPSLDTIARCMGYADTESVRRYIRRLKNKKNSKDTPLLKVDYRKGNTSVYDFEGLTRECQRLENEREGTNKTPEPSAKSRRVVSADFRRGSPQISGAKKKKEEKEEKKVIALPTEPTSDPTIIPEVPEIPVATAAKVAQLRTTIPPAAELAEKIAQPDIAEAIQLFESELGQLKTPLMAQIIASDVEDYGIVWIREAVKRSILRGVRKWDYVQGILGKWKLKGGMDGSADKAYAPGETATPAAPRHDPDCPHCKGKGYVKIDPKNPLSDMQLCTCRTQQNGGTK